MLRLTLQRLAVKRRVAEQLEAVSLEDVLRRMQSSSLTNPARSLEAHFALTGDGADERSAAPALPKGARAASAAVPVTGEVLRDVLSDRLVLEVRRYNMQRHFSLDDGSLMLANCLRHRLAAAATQETFAFWQRCMNRAAYTADGSTATSAAAGELAQFQSLVRVMEACLDADEQRQRERAATAVGDRGASSSAAPPALAGDAIDLTLEHWAAVVDVTEKHWALFADHGASTAGLLVQFMSLVLLETSRASPAATAVRTAELEAQGDKLEETGSAATSGGFVSGLRLLSHLRTDRALLQERVLCLCDRATTSLYDVEVEADARASDAAAPRAAVSPATSSAEPWWHRPHDLVRLSQAMRRIDAYEAQHEPPPTGGGSRFSQPGEKPAGARRVNSARGLGAAAAPRSDRTRTPAVRPSLSGATRGSGWRAASARSSRPQSAAPSTTSSAPSRWVPRMPSTWWPVPAAGAAGASTPSAAAGSGIFGLPRRLDSGARVARRLGLYVTHHALTHMTLTPIDASRPSSAARGGSGGAAAKETNATAAVTGSRSATADSTSTAAPLPLPQFAVTLALCTISFSDVAEVFETVRTTAASTAATDAVTSFAWWVRDVIYHRNRQRSLQDVGDVAGLLRIAEVCLAHPDGTQTVLAEALKCVQRSCGFMWRVRDALAPATAASPHSCSAARARRAAEEGALALLWARACDVVSAAMPLLTVRAEAQRTLQELAHTASQSSASELAVYESAAAAGLAVARRHQRQGLLVLACLQLQSPDGALSVPFTRVLRELVLSLPFECDEADRGGLGAVVRALYVFTRPRTAVPVPLPAAETDGEVWEPVVPHLVGELHRLLSPASEDCDVTPTTAAAADLEDAWMRGERLLTLQQRLTASERELLRAALREVRLLARHSEQEVLSGTLVLNEEGDGAEGSRAVSLWQTRRSRRAQPPDAAVAVASASPQLATTRSFSAVRSGMASPASPSNRRGTAMWTVRSSSSVSPPAAHDAAAAAAAEHRRRTVDSANAVLLQAKADTLILRFRRRRTPGYQT